MFDQSEIDKLKQQLSQRVVGQERLVERLLIALLADGHLLVEGAPGLAKTRVIKVLGDSLEGDFCRIQFTPDLLPSDLTGTEIYRPQEASFTFQEGPLFHNIVLADEINRAPAKVQSALLEAMGERQITVAGKTYPLPPLFLVMATQNPIEQEGTYPLPEAQLDRFLMHIMVDYPSVEEERSILRLVRGEQIDELNKSQKTLEKVSQENIFQAREEVLNLHMSEEIERYIVELVIATRNMHAYGDDISDWLQFGASPRATISLDRCARAHAWISQRDYVTPHDVQAVSTDVLRHRLILNYEAEAEGVTTEQVVTQLLERIAVP